MDNTTASAPQPGQAATGTENKSPVDQSQDLILGKFKTVDDLKVSYKELESKLGDLAPKAKQGELAQSYKDQADNYRSELEKRGWVESDQTPVKIHALEQEIKEIKFTKNHPEAEEYLDLIKSVAVAKYGGDFEAAIQDRIVKAVLDLGKKVEQQEDGKSVIETNKKIAATGQDYEDAFRRAEKTKDFTEVLRLKGITKVK